MQGQYTEIVERLRLAGQRVKDIGPGDVDVVVKVGAGLEEVMGEIEESAPSLLFDLVCSCLEGLKTVYENIADPPARLVAAIGDACDAAASALLSPDDCEAIVSVASAQLEAASASEDACGAGPQEDMNLDDVATLLLQIEPTDTDDLKRASAALVAISINACAAAADPIKRAAAILAAIAAGTADEESASFTEVGCLIEKAMVASEDLGMGCDVVPEPQAEAKPVDIAPPAPTAPKPVAKAESVACQLPDDADTGLLGEFVTECLEYIEGAEASLLDLETDHDNLEAVNVVFRAFHTIKGTSAFLGLVSISELAHKAESLLSRVREGEIRCTGGYADLSLRSIDMLKDLILQVQSALGGAPMKLPDGFSQLIDTLADPDAAGINGDSFEMASVPRVGDILVAEGAALRERVETVEEEKEDEDKLGEALLKAAAASVTDVAKALRTQKKLSGNESGVESSVRVRTDRLDRLIDTVGELVIAQSMVSQDGVVMLRGHHELSKKVTHMGKIVRELQYLSMSMRMVPLKPTFQKMNRLVRDVAKKSGKLVEFITEGEETEIDRNMVDIINDPLVHMVRNAVDHGIEPPDVRVQNGKPKTGTVKLRAFHSGGTVVVEMKDDGRGLSREKIVEKAISKGLIETDKGMSDGEVFNMIFEPGFSTADQVTDISGRGVGLDVVKKNVESMRGRIEITSEFGKGCTFSVRLPLTLAVTDGMLVRVGDEKFIIPTINIYMSFRPNPEALSTVTGRGELVMLRGELMPVFRLHRLFGITGGVEELTQGLLVILEDGDRRCALLVDELLGQQHVVAKTLGDGFGDIPGISGGAILGDGRVGLIIDPGEVASLARSGCIESRGGEVMCLRAA